MNRQYLAFAALAVSMLYGAGFSVFEETPRGYAPLGGVLVALSWIAVGIFGRDESRPRA